MAEQQSRFEDGAAYQRYMGRWSRLAGGVFLDWLRPRQGWRWIDIGCGGGAFSELLVERCAPAEVHGIDPSEAQLAFARTRPAARVAQFRQGDAMALPFPDSQFDAAVMALVIFFVPEPARAVAEMLRVVRPGGLVAAYAWDLPGNGFPAEPILAEMRAAGIEYPLPPSAAASRLDALHRLWRDAGFDEVEAREITVTKAFADFDDFWTAHLAAPLIAKALASIGESYIERLETRVRQRLPADGAGLVVCTARANAVRGRVPDARGGGQR